jgi:predicted dithiol-disulfide oxidoreductase (DUF899 family)
MLDHPARVEGDDAMTKHATSSREEWQAANARQFEREKELHRLSEELSRERRVRRAPSRPKSWQDGA